MPKGKQYPVMRLSLLRVTLINNPNDARFFIRHIIQHVKYLLSLEINHIDDDTAPVRSALNRRFSNLHNDASQIIQVRFHKALCSLVLRVCFIPFCYV